MQKQKLIARAAIQIQKPVDVVFDAIVNPEKMSQYFISKSNGWMEEGKNLIWKFPEFDIEVPIRVGKIEKDRLISYYWEMESSEMLIEMNLSSAENNSTVIAITEKEMDLNEAGLEWLQGNTEGWANFLACLKAYLEYGINLRKGAFEFRK